MYELVSKFGSREGVVEKVLQNIGEVQQGVFEVERIIEGVKITIRGFNLNGIIKLGSIFIK